MIVISPDLTLAAVGDYSPNSPVIGWDTVIAAVVADSESTDYPASNLLNDSTALRWQAGSGATQYLTFTVPGGEQVDYLAIARHNFGTIAATISVETQAPGGGEPWVEVIEEFIPANDTPIIARFTPQNAVGVRLKIQPADEIPRAAVAYVGLLLVMQRRVYVGHTPIVYGRSARITNARSESGDFLGRIVLAESLDTAVEFQNLTPAWYRSTLEPFIEASKETPFFFAWRPATYPTEVGFCWMTNEPRPSNQRPNGMMQISFQMSGVKS